MEDINVDINSLIVLLQFLGFNIIYELNSFGLEKPENNEVHMKTKNCDIKLNQLQILNENQRESLVIPELNEESRIQVHEKLVSIFNLISRESGLNYNSTEIVKIRRGSSINVSKSFTVNHNVVVNVDTADICTSPPVRCSSPIVPRLGRQTPSNGNSKSITDMLMKARNFIDLAMDMSARSRLGPGEMGLNSTFTKDQTVEQCRSTGPRISNIKVSPLNNSEAGDIIHVDSIAHLMDIANSSSVSHMSTPKELSKAMNYASTNEKKNSGDKKWKHPLTKIGIVKQSSKANGIRSIRNSPLGTFKENRVDTPRPIGANRSRSTTNLASPYLRTIPRSAAGNSNNNTPSPRYNGRLVESNKLTPVSGLRKPGWYTKK